MRRQLLRPLIATLFIAALPTGVAQGNNGDRSNKTFEYTVGLWATCRTVIYRRQPVCRI
jgi:hypothetical protein